MKILLTGATGFVGKHLLKSLVYNGYSVIALVRRTSNTNFLQQYTKEIYFTEDGLDDIFIKNHIDGIVHTATAYGQNSSISEVLETNVLFPLKLIEYSVKYGSHFFINTDSFFTKSIGEYAYLNSYTSSKKILTSLIEQFANTTTVVNLKLEHVYGENDGDNKFIMQILKKLTSNEPFIDLTDGLQKRDFVYIEDVVEAFILILKNIEAINGFASIEVGTGKSISIREAVEIMHHKTKSKSILNFGALPTRIGEFKDSRANIDFLMNIGWRVKYNFETGIEKILEKTKN